MTINQAKILKNALYDVQQMELDYIDMLPKYDIDDSEKIKAGIVEISKSFSKRKKRISGKFIVILAAAIISVLLIVSASASETVREIIVNIYETYIQVNIKPNDDKENLEKPIKEYEASYIPEGYIKTSVKKYPALIETNWDNGEYGITLSQSKPRNGGFGLDNETEYHTTIINGKTVYYMHKYNTYFAIWSDGEYIFDVSCYDSVSLEELKKIIESIAPTEANG